MSGCLDRCDRCDRLDRFAALARTVFPVLFCIGVFVAGCHSSEYVFNPGTGTDRSESEWVVEGTGSVDVVNNTLVLREDVDGRGMVVWLTREVADDFALAFDVSFSNNRCIGVYFFAATGPGGTDLLDQSLVRTGDYEEYLRGHVHTYSLSLHRYWPDGRRNPGSNIRRNPGAHIIATAEDPAIEAGQTYHVTIEKRGARIRTYVDGSALHDVVDDGSHGPVWRAGKLGFRLRGDTSCSMTISNVRVR